MQGSLDAWNVKAALDWTTGYFGRKGDEHPRLSAEWLLSEACGMRRVDLYVDFDRVLSMDERDTLRDYVRRRAAGEPLQYITGEVAFRHIMVKVAHGVLIPRPETEVLVSEALSLLAPLKRRCAIDSLGEEERAAVLSRRADGSSCGEAARGEAAVADICTGSGCIACSIAYERPDARVTAVDIAPDAVALARDNVFALGLEGRVQVLQGDLAAPLDFAGSGAGSYDLVVSNPPYVPEDVMGRLPSEVADFEPRLALAGGDDGLDVFRRLIRQAAALLKPGGGFACELHEGHLDHAAVLASEAGFEQVRIVDDLAGRPRVLTARMPR